MPEIAAALARVQEEIALAAQRSGRSAADVELVAVSKGVTAARIREAIAAGHRSFGENRVREAVAKHKELEREHLRWHFVGRLQRNKVRHIVGFVDLVHSLDRVELGEEIGRRAKATKPVEALVEVNTSGEESKGGVSPQDLPSLIERVSSIDGLRVAGLMTMAPVVEAPEEARTCFRALAAAALDLRRKFPELGIRHLSMGMSQDYVVAVEEGATIVRVGTAIFGPRPKRN